MDKDQTTANDAEDVKTVVSDTVESEMSDSQDDAYVEVKTDQVVVKKSGGGLSLLLSFLALVLAGYTLYQQWQKPTSEPSDQLRTLNQEIEQLKSSLESISTQTTQNKNAFSSINRLVSEQGVRLTEVESNEPLVSEANDIAAFDNSNNEAALRQLTQELNAQQATIVQLQNEMDSRPSSGIAKEELLLDQDFIDKAAAVQTLVHIQMLVDNHNIPAAIDVFDNFLLATQLNNNWKSKIERLASILKNVELVDLSALTKQLEDVEQTIDNIQLETENTTEESNWYDRFVSVKKINADSGVDSSVALIEIKTSLKRKLYEAKLFLSLQDQNGWQKSLSQLIQLVNQNLPKQTELQNQISTLSMHSVVHDIPGSFDIEAIMSELKGLR